MINLIAIIETYNIMKKSTGTFLLITAMTISIIGCTQEKFKKLNNSAYTIQPDTTMVQEEVCAILTKKNELVVAWVDRKIGTDEKFISYTSTYENKKKWHPITTYNPNEYLWTGNPALAEDESGNIYLIAMSNNYDGKNLPTNGVFELSRTNDGGKTWSEWKKIVQNTEDFQNMADKPSLIAKGNGELYLSYINFNSNKDNILESKGDVIFMKSKDKGENWSDKLKIDNKRNWKPSSMEEVMVSGGVDFGEQGPSLSFFKGKLLLSYGSYQKNGIWLATSSDDGSTFSVNKISDLKINTPVTKLYTNNSNLIVVVAYEAHDIGNTYYLQSNDAGKTFSTVQISKNGSIATGTIEKGKDLNFMWNEKTEDNVDTKYMTVQDDKVIVKSFFSEKKMNPSFFIGAYQDLLIDKNNLAHAFWIDWSKKGGRLIYSQLK